MATRKPPQRKPDVPDPFSPQAELTPVAQATAAATDAARAAIAIINTQLSEFDKVDAGLAELERRYKGTVYAVETPQGMKDATAARLDIRKPRYAVEEARKAAKAPVLALGRDIDARAVAITTRLTAIESPIDKQIKAEEAREAKRIADIEECIAGVQATPARCIGKDAAQLQEVLDALDTLPLAEFAELRERAAAAQQQAMTSVRQLLVTARAAEEAAQLRRQQQAEEDRRAALRLRVTAIGDVLALPYRTSERVQQAIQRLTDTPIGEDWQEYAAAARERKVEVLALLVKRRDELEAEEARLKDLQAAPAPAPAPAEPHPVVTQTIRAWAPAPPARARAQATVACQVCGKSTTALGTRMCAECAARLAGDIEHTLEADLVDAPLGQPGPREHYEADVAPARPSDAEILALVADHYDVTWGQAAKWLRSMDLDAAERQMPLEV